jgi:sulfur carrier protein ThiS
VLDLANDATVADALAELGLPTSACVTVVNGEVARPQTALADGDRVQLYHQQAGG